MDHESFLLSSLFTLAGCETSPVINSSTCAGGNGMGKQIKMSYSFNDSLIRRNTIG